MTTPTGALLTGEEIRELVTIHDADPDSYRSSTYDVRIGRFLIRKGRGFEESESIFVLEPQSVVEVISIEQLSIPPDVTAIAHVKTSLCDVGILALNIGVIDPHWTGRVSTTLVNFSRQEFTLHKGDVFLRLTFLRSNPTERSTALSIPSEETYLKRKRDKVRRFSDTFLNLEESLSGYAGKLFWKFAGYAGILVGLLTLVLNFIVAGVSRNYWPSLDVKKEVAEEIIGDARAASNARLAVMDRRITELNQKIAQLTVALSAERTRSGGGAATAVDSSPAPQPQPVPAKRGEQ